VSPEIERRARKARAAWKLDSVWTEEEAGLAIHRLRRLNPQFEFRFRQYRKVERFSDVEEVEQG
jgi:hypothetical protein